MTRISVVIPSHNRRDLVQRAIRSVLAQTLRCYEIIVVDDGSTDGTEKLLNELFPSVKILRNEKSKGGASARNLGAQNSTGDYIAFLDSDDEWAQDHLERKIQVIEDQSAEGAYGTFFLSESGRVQEIAFGIGEPKQGRIGNYILSTIRFDARTSTFVFKKEAFHKVRFDDNLRKHQDWDLAINFDQYFKFALDTKPTVYIYVGSERERMSNKLNHEASFYFLKKNAPIIAPDSVFIFCIKQIMRCQFQKESRAVINKYLQFAEPYLDRLIFRHKVLYYLVKLRLLNLGLIYRIKKRIK